MHKSKLSILILLIFLAITITSCDNKYVLNNVDTRNHNSNMKIKSELSTNNDSISISILGKKNIAINTDRICDDIYGIGQLDNRWNLNEIDDILNSIKGDWKIDKYIGFVDSSIYYPDLFDYRDNLEESKKNTLIKNYKKKVKSAQNSIPNVYFSVNKHNGEDVISNYINVNGNYLSPISIILSLDRLNDDYPVFVDQTTISNDFYVEYPVIYIKFFIKYNEAKEIEKYEPATLVLSSDNKFYILIDGAFYSVIDK